MAPSTFPEQNDRFTVPTDPGSVPLGQRGDAARNHTENHRDLGDALVKVQENVPLLNHDHSGTGPRSTSKLKQANTHQDADTDKADSSIHHTLGSGARQAAPGNHYHMPPVGHFIVRRVSHWGSTPPTQAVGRRTLSGLSTVKNTSTRYFGNSGSTGVIIRESGLYFVSAFVEGYSVQSGTTTTRWHRIRFAMPSGRDPQYPNIPASHYRTNHGNVYVGARHNNRLIFQSSTVRWLPQGTVVNIEQQTLSHPWKFYGATLQLTALFNRAGETRAVKGMRE